MKRPLKAGRETRPGSRGLVFRHFYIPRDRPGSAIFGARDYTPDIAKVKFHWRMQLNIHWTIPVKIQRKSGNPLEHTSGGPRLPDGVRTNDMLFIEVP